MTKMKRFENKYDGICAECGTHKSAGEGIVERNMDGKWITHCKDGDCAPVEYAGLVTPETAFEFGALTSALIKEKGRDGKLPIIREMAKLVGADMDCYTD